MSASHLETSKVNCSDIKQHIPITLNAFILQTPEQQDKMTTGEETNEELPTIAEDLVVTKYKMSAEIVNKVLREMMAECKPGRSVRDLCILGDKKLTEETSKSYKKDKKITKGETFFSFTVT